MHTETNTLDAEAAPRWLWEEFFNVRYLREQGIPVLGFTWFSLTDQVDWDSALAQDLGRVNPAGLYDLQRRARPVAAAYRELLLQFDTEPLILKSPVLQFCQGVPPVSPAPKIQPKPQHMVATRQPASPKDNSRNRTHSGRKHRFGRHYTNGSGSVAALGRNAPFHSGLARRVLIKPNQTMWRR